ncbi:hypothetical protein GYB59_19020 [bacterium]|nr:hypothetical protein [bacterium]
MQVTIDTGDWYLTLNVKYKITPYRMPTDRGMIVGEQIEDIELDGDGLKPIEYIGHGLETKYGELIVDEKDEIAVAEYREFAADILADNADDAAEQIAQKLAAQRDDMPAMLAG